jgi:UDP-2,4-diacetamido-2,4,6-trideoxy-beta-L-altropyranose hydrolase
MKIVFRVDASVRMGVGHFMRCLTLAEALRERGAQLRFICREHAGNLIKLLQQKAIPVTALPGPAINDTTSGEDYVAWLGVTQVEDVEQTIEALGGEQPDWLIVDHYGLDVEWEQRLRPHVSKLMVIDDLADRAHCCDLLLDQNWFGDDTPTRYRNLVPPHCKCYLGPEYALLKPEYAQLRASMPPRNGTVRRVLVFLGGSDPTNQTSKVLTALMQPCLAHLQVDVVIGQNHPDVEGIAAQVAARPGSTLHQGLPTLAHLMSRADLMISAGGSTTWERLCLGLPAVVISVAANQTSTNVTLMNAGYIDFLGEMNEVCVSNIADAVWHSLANAATLKAQSSLGQKMVSGIGAQVVCQQILSR